MRFDIFSITPSQETWRKKEESGRGKGKSKKGKASSNEVDHKPTMHCMLRALTNLKFHPGGRGQRSSRVQRARDVSRRNGETRSMQDDVNVTATFSFPEKYGPQLHTISPSPTFLSEWYI